MSSLCKESSREQHSRLSLLKESKNDHYDVFKVLFFPIVKECYLQEFYNTETQKLRVEGHEAHMFTDKH